MELIIGKLFYLFGEFRIFCESIWLINVNISFVKGGGVLLWEYEGLNRIGGD